LDATTLMTLSPLLAASPVIQVHTWLAVLAFVIGAFQLLGPKGTVPHRVAGWAWVLLLGVVAISSFWIHSLRVFGPFSPIHALSVVTLLSLPIAVVAARRGKIGRHATVMRLLFFGALLIAGAFTFVPGRVMHAVAFAG
jgi:uncharacterized membrane protein